MHCVVVGLLLCQLLKEVQPLSPFCAIFYTFALFTRVDFASNPTLFLLLWGAWSLTIFFRFSQSALEGLWEVAFLFLQIICTPVLHLLYFGQIIFRKPLLAWKWHLQFVQLRTAYKMSCTEKEHRATFSQFCGCDNVSKLFVYFLYLFLN